MVEPVRSQVRHGWYLMAEVMVAVLRREGLERVKTYVKCVRELVLWIVAGARDDMVTTASDIRPLLIGCS